MKISSILYLLKEGFRNIWSNRAMALTSIGVFVSCLLLSGGAVLLSLNISSSMDKMEEGNLIVVYLKEEVGTLEAVKIGDAIKALPNVSGSVMVPKDEALNEMMSNLGDDGFLLEGLIEENPLPNAYRVTLEDLDQMERTKEQLAGVEGVDRVRGESEVPQKILSLKNSVGTVSFWIIILLVIVSFFIIINTIRITMFSRRKEISIMRSVGATDWFIRVPFIVEGVLIGVISGALATLLLKYLYENISWGVDGLINMGAVPFSNYAFLIALSFVSAGVVFGAVGGVVSIGRYLKNEGGDNDGW